MNKKVIFGIEDKVFEWSEGNNETQLVDNMSGKKDSNIVTGICEHNGEVYVGRLAGSVKKVNSHEKLNFTLDEHEKLKGLASHQGMLLGLSEMAIPTGLSYEIGRQTIDTRWHGFGLYDVEKDKKIKAELSRGGIGKSILHQRPGELSLYGNGPNLYIGSQNFLQVGISKVENFGQSNTRVELEKVTNSICDHPVAGLINGQITIANQENISGLGEREYPTAICENQGYMMLRTAETSKGFKDRTVVERFYEVENGGKSKFKVKDILFEHKYESNRFSFGTRPTLLTYVNEGNKK